LFGDGAAAVVAGGELAKNDDKLWRLKATGSCLIPGSQQAMTWRIGDHGFEMTLDASVPELIQTHLRPWLATFLSDNGLTLEAVRSWAIHPGRPRILGSMEECLGLAADATAIRRALLAPHGSM